MCGRFALGLGGDEIWQDVEEMMPPPRRPRRWENREEFRPHFNVAPTHNAVVIRADVNDHGEVDDKHDGQGAIVQTMKWGLVPSWSKKAADWSNISKTFNARDDTITEGNGMWKSQRGKKRCLIICQGFFEWLKKGSQKVPHFTKMKRQPLMVFAGLWDCTTVDDKPLYTFTIITTTSNKQLSFLHDRMPVIFNSPAQFETWINVVDNPWNSNLANMLQPFDGELDCFKVSPEVGKVGNEGPELIIPVSDRKGSLNSLFAKQASKASTSSKSNSQINSTSSISKPIPPPSPTKLKPPPSPSKDKSRVKRTTSQSSSHDNELDLRTSRPNSEWDSESSEDGEGKDGDAMNVTPKKQMIRTRRPSSPPSPSPVRSKRNLGSSGKKMEEGQLTLHMFDVSATPPKRSSPFTSTSSSSLFGNDNNEKKKVKGKPESKGKRKLAPPASPSKSARKSKKPKLDLDSDVEIKDSTPPPPPASSSISRNDDKLKTPPSSGTPHRHVESGVKKAHKNTDLVPSPKKESASWSLKRRTKDMLIHGEEGDKGGSQDDDDDKMDIEKDLQVQPLDFGEGLGSGRKPRRGVVLFPEEPGSPSPSKGKRGGGLFD